MDQSGVDTHSHQGEPASRDGKFHSGGIMYAQILTPQNQSARRCRSGFALLCSFLVSVALAVQGRAQTTASLSGTVADATGASIPGAKVTFVNEGSKGARVGTKHGTGYFTFAG